MTKQFTPKELEFILESLKYTKIKFEEYNNYLSREFKQKRVNEVDDVIAKVKTILKEEQQ